MKLRHLYSNQPDLFPDIVFHDGLNVVFGEIRLAENMEKDTHNLGKTLLGQVIDFCLLRGLDKTTFLHVQRTRLNKFVFFLEVQTHSGLLLTIRRALANPSKVSFAWRRMPADEQCPPSEWQHWETPFDQSKKLLDGLLGLTAVSPWGFRQAIGYSLRSQKDYNDPFKLAKYGGKDAEWKPLLMHLLGLDADATVQHYEVQADIEKKKADEARQRLELDGLDDRDRLRTLIGIREREIEERRQHLDEYDFSLADAEVNHELVEEIERGIVDGNERRYFLATKRQRILEGLEAGAVVDLDDIRTLFEQAKVYFGEQIRRDFGDLIEFNRAITSERSEYLREELRDVETELAGIEKTLLELNRRRSGALVHLRDHDTFSRYKQVSQELVENRAQLLSLQKQEAAVDRLGQLRKDLTDLNHKREDTAVALKRSIDSGSPRYERLKHYVDDIVFRVIHQHAALYTAVNGEGNPEPKLHLVDDAGHPTSGGEGHTYGRLLCIAFDMAMQRAYVADAFPHFVYHDGVFESLDDRKKLNLIAILREQGGLGLQQIVTVIDSELPRMKSGRFYFHDEEVVLRLHDEGPQGRLFRMDSW